MVNRGIVRRYFPAPLVAVAVLLVLMILLTPVLLSGGQPAPGSIQAQAELIVDRVVGANSTHFYLRAVGPTVRYAQMSIEEARGFVWTGSFPSGHLNWTRVVHATDVLAVTYNTSANPVALNLTAVYAVPGGIAYYEGLIAFNLGVVAGSTALMLFAVTSTSGVFPAAQFPVASLPEIIPLADHGSSP